MPCCGSVGGCGARAVSRKTPIYFIVLTTLEYSSSASAFSFYGGINSDLSIIRPSYAVFSNVNGE